MENTRVQKLTFWGGRALIYFILTAFALLLMFPLIYMVIASLKTTVDFNANPRRLLPYTHVEETFAGQEIFAYNFNVNDDSRQYLISETTIDFNYFGTEENLSEQVQLGSHAQQRRSIDVLAIIPTGYQTSEGDSVSIEEDNLTLIRTDDVFEIAGNDGVSKQFRAYEIVLDDAVVSTYLTDVEVSAPLQAYIVDGYVGSSTEITVIGGESITLQDERDRDRDYASITLISDESYTLVSGYNAIINAFFEQDDPESVVYAIKATIDPVEVIEFQLVNYNDVLGFSDNPNLRLDRALVNTAFVTILVVVGQMTTSLFGGYAFSRLHFRGRDTLFLVYLGSIMVPFVVLIVPIYRLMTALGWENHLAALIVPWIFTAYGTFLIRQFFLSIPRELEEAALLDGCSRFRILWRIFVPLSTPALATHAIFTFLYAWNSFLWPLIIINSSNKDDHVLTLALITLANINADKPNLVMTGAAVMILPPMIVFILAQRYFIEGIATSGLKG